MLKRFVILASIGVALLAIAGISFAWSYQKFLATPLLVPDDGLEFSIPSGTAFSTVATRLAEDGVISNANWLKLYGRLSGEAAKIQAGDYRVAAGTLPEEFVEQLTTGDVILHSFTIVEGWNRWELLDAIGRDERLEHTLTEADWPGFLEEIGAEADSPEGLFLPETYRFPTSTTDRDLLKQAHELLVETLADEWERRASDLPLESPYEALILASIIEKETAKPDERPEIAGVFVRRLNRGMRLQTDPTVIYGLMPEFNGNITRRDLRTDTPYNTYTRGGLPPTPIAMAGRAAIRSALHPADGETLYFVATGLGDGSHKFSVTKEEHDQAVQEYLARLRKQRSNGP
jgi:UPF0755 protein